MPAGNPRSLGRRGCHQAPGRLCHSGWRGRHHGGRCKKGAWKNSREGLLSGPVLTLLAPLVRFFILPGGGSVMRSWSVFLVVMCLAMASLPAQALDPVYRCVVKGVPTFTDTPVKGHRCRSFSHAPPPPVQPYHPPTLTPDVSNPLDPRPEGVEGDGQLSGSDRPPRAAPSGLPPLPPRSLPPRD